MTDLLNASDTAAFLEAMRDVSDTFQKYPLILGDGMDAVELLCGRKSIKNELQAREEGMDINQAFRISFNRQYLDQKGLVDTDGTLLFGYDTPVWMDGERFAIIKLDEPAVFRDKKLSVVMEVVS